MTMFREVMRGTCGRCSWKFSGGFTGSKEACAVRGVAM
jgi:hypothetical protein